MVKKIYIYIQKKCFGHPSLFISIKVQHFFSALPIKKKFLNHNRYFQKKKKLTCIVIILNTY